LIGQGYQQNNKQYRNKRFLQAELFVGKKQQQKIKWNGAVLIGNKQPNAIPLG
jgi:hypothetical protein